MFDVILMAQKDTLSATALGQLQMLLGTAFVLNSNYGANDEALGVSILAYDNQIKNDMLLQSAKSEQ